MNYLPLFILISVIAAGGGAGGIAGYIVDISSRDKESDFNTASARILLGIIVAFTVPLFLSLAQSALIQNILKPINSDQSYPFSELLIVAGFCIVVSFSAQSFIEGLSSKILNELNQTKKIAINASNKSNRNEESLEKIDEFIDRDSDVVGNLVEEGKIIKLSREERALYATSLNTLRTATGIARDANVKKSEISEVLDALVRNGNVEITTSPNTGGRRYRLTARGASALTDVMAKND